MVMEVSSQALMQHRSQGFVFDFGIFTNIEPDHIGPNEHASFEEYLHCKGLLFQQCRVGIVNGTTLTGAGDGRPHLPAGNLRTGRGATSAPRA